MPLYLCSGRTESSSPCFVGRCCQKGSWESQAGELPRSEAWWSQPLKLVVSNNAECLSKSIPWSINKGENLLQHTHSDDDAVDFVFRSFYIYVLSLPCRQRITLWRCKNYMSSIHHLFPLTVRKYRVPLQNDVEHNLISNHNTYVSKHHDGMAGAIRVCCVVG
jgi:hypothetical protein